MRFQNNLGFARQISHDYNEKFAQEGAKIGDTFTLREGARFVVNSGADVTSQIQDVTETSKTLTLNQRYNVAFKFSTQELTLSVDRFSERYLKPVSIALANAVDVYALTFAYQATSNHVGTPGTTPADALTYLQAGQKLDESAAPLDDMRHLAINPKMQSTIVDSLKGLLNAQGAVSQQYMKGRMGTALGFNWFMDQNLRSHTIGAWAGTVVTTAAVSTQGATQIAVGSLTSATAALKKGDIVTVADTYAVNPVSGDAYPHLKQFSLAADVTASSNAATITVTEPMYSSGPLKNVSALPGNSKAVTIFGTPAVATPQALAFHKEAFVLGMAPLYMPDDVNTKGRAVDPDTGMSIRIISGHNILTDDVVWRADILFGMCARRPEGSCRVSG
jgi:hypothetical protein